MDPRRQSQPTNLDILRTMIRYRSNSNIFILVFLIIGKLAKHERTTSELFAKKRSLGNNLCYPLVG